MKYGIDKSIPLPLYYQLKQILINKIEDGEYREDEAIPSEFELIGQYEVSRTTVRQALNELVNEGYLYKRKGVGTFVSARKKSVGQQMNPGYSIFKLDEVINRNGYVCKTEFLKAGVIKATADIAAELKIGIGEEVWYMDRLRYANTKPATVSRSHIRKDLVKDFLKDAANASQHFHDYLDSRNLVITLIKEELTPGLADQEMEKYLKVDKRQAIMIVKTIGYLEDETPVEYTISSVNVSFIKMFGTIRRH